MCIRDSLQTPLPITTNQTYTTFMITEPNQYLNEKENEEAIFMDTNNIYLDTPESSVSPIKQIANGISKSQIDRYDYLPRILRLVFGNRKSALSICHSANIWSCDLQERVQLMKIVNSYGEFQTLNPIRKKVFKKFLDIFKKGERKTLSCLRQFFECKRNQIIQKVGEDSNKVEKYLKEIEKLIFLKERELSRLET
eukprot:TRINITY_DN182_c0_g1_i1.p2 TRINITY_DN182_c0_g1~~TRINITY_DN182_c0_g1_i1.p2  ORF type:complete len:196 (+),score=26.33 TRINITY_DN182_c0_g1_i1:72-659(+)